MLDVLQMHVTLRCNMHCNYCSYRDEPNRNVELPFGEAVRYLKEAHSLGCRKLKVSGGGEPMMYEMLDTVLGIAKGLGMFIHLQTNGLALAQQHRRLVDDIRISCGDGSPFEEPDVLPNGYSYVVTRAPDYDNLNRLIEYARPRGMYVRIVQDETDIEATPTVREIQQNLFAVSGLVSFWDGKLWHGGLNPCTPSITAPLVGADGCIYPCCRFQYAQELMWRYNPLMRMGTSLLNLIPHNGTWCNRCYY